MLFEVVKTSAKTPKAKRLEVVAMPSAPRVKRLALLEVASRFDTLDPTWR